MSNEWEWLHWSWFLPETWQGFVWDQPWVLWGLPFVWVPVVLRRLLVWNKRRAIEAAFAKGQFASQPVAWLRLLPPFWMTLALAFLLVALARPQQSSEQVEQWTEGIDIILALDISESMQILDLKPNRLEAAKKVARQFVEGRLQDRIGLVVFSGEAISYAPLTTDYSLLYSLIENIDFQMVDKKGTAIGSALAVGINRLQESTSASKVLILLSDGDNTAGSVAPVTAAELAYARQIKIYTIGVGEEGQVPNGVDAFGNTQYIENSLDETTLRKIAQIGQGQYFRATNNATLNQIFTRIDQYEKAEIKETRYKDTKDLYFIYLSWAMLCWLCWLATKWTFLNNATED